MILFSETELMGTVPTYWSLGFIPVILFFGSRETELFFAPLGRKLFFSLPAVHGHNPLTTVAVKPQSSGSCAGLLKMLQQGLHSKRTQRIASYVIWSQQEPKELLGVTFYYVQVPELKAQPWRNLPFIFFQSEFWFRITSSKQKSHLETEFHLVPMQKSEIISRSKWKQGQVCLRHWWTKMKLSTSLDGVFRVYNRAGS